MRVTLAVDQIGSGPHPMNRRVKEDGDTAGRRNDGAPATTTVERRTKDGDDDDVIVFTPMEEDNDDGGAKPWATSPREAIKPNADAAAETR